MTLQTDADYRASRDQTSRDGEVRGGRRDIRMVGVDEQVSGRSSAEDVAQNHGWGDADRRSVPHGHQARLADLPVSHGKDEGNLAHGAVHPQAELGERALQVRVHREDTREPALGR